MLIFSGVLVNLEDSKLTTGGTDQLVAMVTRVSEVLEVNTEVIMAKHGTNGTLAGHPQGDGTNSDNTTEVDSSITLFITIVYNSATQVNFYSWRAL